MSDRHLIRLRPPWEDRPALVSSATPALRVVARRFGRPTGLQIGDRVWLVVERIADTVSTGDATTTCVKLNGAPLGELGPLQREGRWEIAGQLHERNELALEYDGAVEAAGSRTSPPPWIGEVRLEIEAGDSLQAGNDQA